MSQRLALDRWWDTLCCEQMRLTGAIQDSLTGPLLTRGRIAFAMVVAVITDFLQIMLGPWGWVGADQGLDVVAMILTTMAIGFHPLLLPTFVLDFIPVVGMLPSWTACTLTVVLLRKKDLVASPPTPPVVDIQATVTASQPASPVPPRLQEPGK
jgi:hypothetical protein